MCRSDLPAANHVRFLDLTLSVWGMDPLKRKNLWNCYFTTPPHLYHLLHYVHAVDLHRWTGLSTRKLEQIMRSPTLNRSQVRALSPQLMPYIETLTNQGNPAGLRLERSLRNPDLLSK